MTQILWDKKLDFDDVLMRPKYSGLSSRSEVELVREFKTLNSKQKFSGIGIVVSNMDTTGTFNMATELSKYKVFTALHKFYKKEELISFFSGPQDYTFYTTGISNDDLQKLKEVYAVSPFKKLNVDIANGHIKVFYDKIKELRHLYPEMIIMAGNIVTPECAHRLFDSGADIAKVGMGSGGNCLSRKMTGCGYKQLSCVLETSEIARNMGGMVCSDGGCKIPGDIGKALGAGASLVMIGSMVSGTDECSGEWEYEYEVLKDSSGVPLCTGNKLKKAMKFYGMSSKIAADKYHGGLATYRASEGHVSWTPYKGSVKDVIQEVLGGLRSTCTYIGCKNIKNVSKCTTFMV